MLSVFSKSNLQTGLLCKPTPATHLRRQKSNCQIGWRTFIPQSLVTEFPVCNPTWTTVFAAGCALLRQCRRNVRSKRRCNGSCWSSAPSPDFDDFVDVLVGRWHGWRWGWIEVNGPLDSHTRIEEWEVKVSEVLVSCMACGKRVAGLDDFGQRERANPELVLFSCGSWFQGPRTGVAGGEGEISATLTFGPGHLERCTFTIKVRNGCIQCCQVGWLTPSTEGKGLECPSPGVLHLDDWVGTALRASAGTQRAASSGPAWHSGRLRWHNGQPDNLFRLLRGSGALQELNLPMGLYAAAAKLSDGCFWVALAKSCRSLRNETPR